MADTPIVRGDLVTHRCPPTATSHMPGRVVAVDGGQVEVLPCSTSGDLWTAPLSDVRLYP